MDEPELARNVAAIRSRITQACDRSGRDPSAVTLVAVTKTVALPRIRAVYDAGVREFGENYVQEALTKVGDSYLSAAPVHWHFIGHLQRNKVRDIIGRFALIHSVDSFALAAEIGRRSQTADRMADILLEVKLDPTAAKFGLAPEQTLLTAQAVLDIPGVRLCGLMGMAPFGSEPEAARPAFRTLRALFDQLPAESRKVLSMGMSSDFEVAIEEGATLVRIGTALFGRRPPPD
jgi:pyridoxal phosphate enzyme (YggS family)